MLIRARTGAKSHSSSLEGCGRLKDEILVESRKAKTKARCICVVDKHDKRAHKTGKIGYKNGD